MFLRARCDSFPSQHTAQHTAAWCVSKPGRSSVDCKPIGRSQNDPDHTYRQPRIEAKEARSRANQSRHCQGSDGGVCCAWSRRRAYRCGGEAHTYHAGDDLLLFEEQGRLVTGGAEMSVSQNPRGRKGTRCTFSRYKRCGGASAMATALRVRLTSETRAHAPER